MLIACAFNARAMMCASGSSALSSRRRASFSSLRCASSCDAGSPRVGVHPHVERARLLVGEPAVRIVELHRRDAEVRENDVRSGEPFVRQHLRQPREIAPVRDERVRAEPRRAQPFVRARQLDRIDVEANQPSAGLNAFEDRAGVAAEPERAVDRHVAGPGRQRVQHLRDHDRAVHPRRRLAGLDDLLNVGLVPLRVQLFVLLVKLARVLAGISNAPFGLRFRHGDVSGPSIGLESYGRPALRHQRSHARSNVKELRVERMACTSPSLRNVISPSACAFIWRSALSSR